MHTILAMVIFFNIEFNIFKGDPMCIRYFGFNLYTFPAALQINVQKKASPRDIA